MSGTFYHSPAPGEPPFVKVGDKVTKGQTIGIIEAMKLMNEIEVSQKPSQWVIRVSKESTQTLAAKQDGGRRSIITHMSHRIAVECRIGVL